MDLMVEPTTEKGKQTVAALAKAAQNNFYEKGYVKTTIKDITKDAGVSVGAFYLYFKDKYSLYRYVVAQYGQFIRTSINKKIGKVNSRKEAERQGLIAYIEIVRENPDIYNIIWESITIDKAIFFDYYEEFAESYVRQLNKARAKGEMAFENTELVAYMFMGVHTFLGIKYGIINSEDSAEEIADEFIQLLTNGIFTG